MLAEAHLLHPPNLTFVPLDFEHKALAAGLVEAGFDPQLPAFFGWLGVVPYLTLHAFRATIRDIASLPPGTTLAFDYGLAPEVLSPMHRLALQALADGVAAAGRNPSSSSSHPISCSRNSTRPAFPPSRPVGLKVSQRALLPLPRRWPQTPRTRTRPSRHRFLGVQIEFATPG